MKRGGYAGCFVRLIWFVFFAAAAAGGATYLLLTLPYKNFSQAVILDFPKGTSTAGMGVELARAGVIRYGWEFLAVRAMRPGARLQAGEYQFAKAAPAAAIFDRIVRGDVFYYELTVPEGSNIFDISAGVDQLGFMKGADFLRAARDPSLIHDLAPKAPTLEGYLFPSTYRVTRTTTPQQLCRMMTELFRKHWHELAAGSTMGVNDTVTVASMVEKETAVPDERPKVASVFDNRLRIGMTLDCDPTTIYAAMLEARYHGTIYRSNLNSSNLYNTYKHAGLPPGPIANPGADSLRAALQPVQTDYLYFVAKPDGSGTHQFSTTIDQHNRAVQQYRRGTKPADKAIMKR